ncbi:hypothetical protein [Ornithinibacillus xuwenensis]|uniref:YceG-like family protein n=1 Tax=Ornithinibacillus xuwenensis TaxID=3144668 RepID=A0ABU9XEL6_9BACI
MKQPIRAFAVGLFTAAVVMLIVNYFTESSDIDLSEMPVEDVVNEMKEKGYRVLTESEYISMSMNGTEEGTEKPAEDTENQEADNTEEDSTATEKETEKTETEQTETEENTSENATKEESQTEETAKSYTLTIESGMPSSAISDELEANGIIDDAAAFIAYLEDEGYALRIQLGDFTVSSDMSYYEIAEALTK